MACAEHSVSPCCCVVFVFANSFPYDIVMYNIHNITFPKINSKKMKMKYRRKEGKEGIYHYIHSVVHIFLKHEKETQISRTKKRVRKKKNPGNSKRKKKKKNCHCISYKRSTVMNEFHDTLWTPFLSSVQLISYETTNTYTHTQMHTKNLSLSLCGLRYTMLYKSTTV